MLIVSSTVGSPTTTGWKRRSRAASFSMYFRYSSRVVAPIVWSSPRASIGFNMFDASIDPSAAPAPTTVCSSSMKRITWPCASVISLRTAFRHIAANDPRRQSFDDGGLADAGFADQDRVVLGAARQHLDDAANLLVAA